MEYFKIIYAAPNLLGLYFSTTLFLQFSGKS